MNVNLAAQPYKKERHIYLSLKLFRTCLFSLKLTLTDGSLSDPWNLENSKTRQVCEKKL